MRNILKTIIVALALFPLASHAQSRFGKWVLLQDGQHCLIVQNIEPSSSISDITPEQLGALYGKVIGATYRGQDPNTVVAGHQYTIAFELARRQIAIFVRGDSFKNVDGDEMEGGYITVNGQKNDFQFGGSQFPQGGGEIHRVLTNTNPYAIIHADRVTFEMDDIPYELDMRGFIEAAHNYQACLSNLPQ